MDTKKNYMVRHLSAKQHHWKNVRKSFNKLLSQINVDIDNLSQEDKDMITKKGLDSYVHKLRQSVESESSTPGGVIDPLQSRVEVLSDDDG